MEVAPDAGLALGAAEARADLVYLNSGRTISVV